MTIASLSHSVPPNEDTDGGNANVHADYHVAEEDPVADKVIVALAGTLAHNIGIRRVERQGSSRGTVSHQVDPEELYRVESFGDADHCG